MPGRNYDVLLLRPQEIRDVIDIKQAIDLVEQGYREAQGFPIINAPRRRVHSKRNVRISSFPGGIDGLGVIGSLTRCEQVTHDPSSQEYPYREHPVYLLWNSQSAKLQCIMIGEITEKHIGFSSLMALRTAATSGVGFRHLVRKDAKVAGVFGTGGQALHKILALQNERSIETYKVFSRNSDNRKKFCERMSRLIEAKFLPTDMPKDIVRDSDVVICATSSNVPVFDGVWLEPGQHLVTIVGSNSALVKGGWLKEGRRENDDETVRRADFIITNWRRVDRAGTPSRNIRSDPKRYNHLGQDPRARGSPRWIVPRSHERRTNHVPRQQQRNRGGGLGDRPRGLRAMSSIGPRHTDRIAAARRTVAEPLA